MNYKIESIPLFDKQAKRLSKKYPSIKTYLSILLEGLADNPEQQGAPLGNNFYKIRLSISAKGKGKRGGARIIIYVKVSARKVYLSSIYEKGVKETISDKELKLIFNSIP